MNVINALTATYSLECVLVEYLGEVALLSPPLTPQSPSLCLAVSVNREVRTAAVPTDRPLETMPLVLADRNKIGLFSSDRIAPRDGRQFSGRGFPTALPALCGVPVIFCDTLSRAKRVFSATARGARSWRACRAPLCGRWVLGLTDSGEGRKKRALDAETSVTDRGAEICIPGRRWETQSRFPETPGVGWGGRSAGAGGSFPGGGGLLAQPPLPRGCPAAAGQSRPPSGTPDTGECAVCGTARVQRGGQKTRTGDPCGGR